MSSKIKVDTIENVAGSGNVSLGSGHNLVVPGNNTTSGNATVGGTFGVTGATTTAGITSSAAHTVTTSTHANASVFKSTGNTQIMLQDTDASANDQFWGLQNSGGEFNILTCDDDRASGFVTPMTITQAGHVKKPNQPMFSISGGPNSYRDGSGNETVILHGQSGSFAGDMNIGGHFSYSTGRFTAPVAGNYMFTYTLTSGDTNAHFIELRKNNSSLTTILLYTTQYQSGCHSTIYTLAANDYVTAQRRANTYGVYSCVFSGFLIG